MNENNINGVSIIVCCHNSAARLPETIRHLALQHFPSVINAEVIIVDNNSSDNTAAVAKKEWQKYNLSIPLSVIHENQQGLWFAKQAGAATAQYAVLIFCDDDNWLRQDYISVAYSIMQSKKNIGIAGGQSVAAFEISMPSWFNNYQSAYAVGKQMPSSGYANERNYLFGAGMITRKEIFQQLHEVPHQLLLSGRVGKQLLSGEDSELCLVTKYMGYDLYYDERLQFTHYITASRLQWTYCVKLLCQGLAYPQIYFAMYDYCFKTLRKKEQPVFENLYKWNRRKQLRLLLNEWRGFKNFFAGIAAITFSKPGNDKEIRIKKPFCKLLYMMRNKQKLKTDFAAIHNAVFKIEKSSSPDKLQYRQYQ